MKAVLLTKIGKSGNLLYKSVEKQIPLKNEALVKVKFCGLNHLDLLVRQGKRLGPKIFPHILGSEIVGELENGDMVAVYPWIFCGKCLQCKSGNENICDNGGTIGRTSWGGYAEYVVVPVQNLIKIPKSLSPAKACAAILSSTTAYHLVERAKIKNNALVLVTGATGGVGTALIQLLKIRKCKVVCSSSHSRKKRFLKDLGADFVVPMDKLEREIDYVIDLMGGNVWSKGVELLAKNGTMVFCGTTLEEEGKINIGWAFSRQINILGSSGGTIKDLKAVFRLLKKGLLKPVIDSTFALKKAELALRKLENQKAFGKILLAI